MSERALKGKVLYKKDKSEAIAGFIFGAIPVVGFLLFGMVPLVFSLIMSFSDVPNFDMRQMTGFSGQSIFTNYITIFKDPKFALSIKNTFYAMLALPLSMIIGLILAVLLNQGLKGSRILRTIFFIPYVCSIVAISLMWRTLLNKNYGAINQFLGLFGIEPVSWLFDPKAFMPGMIIMLTWCGVGFNLILYSAALTSISPTYYEAAEMDGANSIQKFFKVTLPLLSPTTFYLLIVGIIGSLQVFAQIQAINAVNNSLVSPTGPSDSGLTIVFYLYNKAFVETGGLGQAAAVGWVLTLATGALTALNFIAKKKWVFENEKK